MQTRKQFSDIKTNLEKNRYYNNFQNNNESNNNINNNNSNKAILNFNKIINNLKISLEKFDSSIKELKLNIDKDKEEQSQKIQELEETFNSKLNSLKTGQIYSKPIQKGKNEPDISPSIIKELFSKINLLEQKSKSLESNLNNKLSSSKKVSILPIGVINCDGEFLAGDVIDVKDIEGKIIAKGITNYGSYEIKKIMSHNSKEIKDILGYKDKEQIIHADDLVVFKDKENG